MTATHFAAQLALAMQHAGHPLRLKILGELVKGPNSPKGTYEQFGVQLGTIAYHYRTMAAAGIIALVREEPRRGTTEHFYGLTSLGDELARDLGLKAEPLFALILRGLRDRGWKTDGDGVYIDPEGNKYGNVDAAISAQTFREIAMAGDGSERPLEDA